MTVRQATQHLLFQLYHIYDAREARNIADLVMEKITEWKKIDRILHKELPLLPDKMALLNRYIEELLDHKPVQYVLGEAWFYGMKLLVNEKVLIPRPETEELVRWVLGDIVDACSSGHGVGILDVGTGSGCIPIALKKNLPDCAVCSCDISEEALEIAKRNALSQDTAIRFLALDFLDEDARKMLPGAGVLVSNPPYVPEKDRETLAKNVLHYEPAKALFVGNKDPLVFYRAIGRYANSRPTNKMVIYVEIHEAFAREVCSLFQQQGFTHIELRKDLQGRDRMVKVY